MLAKSEVNHKAKPLASNALSLQILELAVNSTQLRDNSAHRSADLNLVTNSRGWPRHLLWNQEWNF